MRHISSNYLRPYDAAVAPFSAGLLAVALLLVIVAHTSETKRFRPRDYPSPKYKVTRQTVQIGEVRVSIVQVKFTPTGAEQMPFMCRAWVDVGGTKPKDFYFADIEAVGLSYGLFIPPDQPSPEYLLISKVGDYDGRLILIRADGRASEVNGEGFIPDGNRNLLFTTHAGDDQLKLLVFDLKHDRVAFDGPVPAIKEWYRDQRLGIVFTSSRSNGTEEDRTKVYAFDIASHRVQPISASPEDFLRFEPVTYPFDESQFEDCTSPTQRRTNSR